MSRSCGAVRRTSLLVQPSGSYCFLGSVGERHSCLLVVVSWFPIGRTGRERRIWLFCCVALAASRAVYMCAKSPVGHTIFKPARQTNVVRGGWGHL